MGMLEARLRILRNNTMSEILSEQDVVDCSPYSQGEQSISGFSRSLRGALLSALLAIGTNHDRRGWGLAMCM